MLYEVITLAYACIGCTVLDPACGSGGMFVQSAHVVERQHLNRITSYNVCYTKLLRSPTRRADSHSTP